MRFIFAFFLLLFAFSFPVCGQMPGEVSVFTEEAAAICAALDDNTLAAQVLLTGIDGKGFLVPAMRTLLEKIPPGGIMLFKYNLDTPRHDVKKLLAEASALVSAKTGIPPFAAVDHEGGFVHRFGSGVEKLPSAFSFGELARREGWEAALGEAGKLYSRSAKEIRELGITMVLGPVAETLDNDNRLFLETRSYGSDPDFTRAAASVFIESMDAAGIGSAVKHFPGNAAGDPHFGVPVLKAGKAALDVMVKPFAGIIGDLNPLCVMVSHVMVPALDSRRNASLSRYVIEDWLRDELGFKGIVLADDFSMAAVSGTAAPEVEALNAGVDMIMAWPSNINAVHTSILEALKSGRLSRARLLEAAERIVAGKIRYGLIKPQL